MKIVISQSLIDNYTPCLPQMWTILGPDGKVLLSQFKPADGQLTLRLTITTQILPQLGIDGDHLKYVLRMQRKVLDLSQPARTVPAGSRLELLHYRDLNLKELQQIKAATSVTVGLQLSTGRITASFPPATSLLTILATFQASQYFRFFHISSTLLVASI